MRVPTAVLVIVLVATLAGLPASATATQGFVGALEVTPDRGPVGSKVTLTGTGLPANATLDVLWTSVEAEWLQDPPLFKGIGVREIRYRIATVTTGADGRFSATLKVPEEYGGAHDIYVAQAGRTLNKTGFRTLPAVTLLPTS